MLQRHHPPGIDSRPATPAKGFEHLKDEWVAILRWLIEARVEHVVLGPTGAAIRGEKSAEGIVAIVPAPYHRNLDRLARALVAVHARLRTQNGHEVAARRFSARNLCAGEHWKLRCEAAHDLDIEMYPAERYSELLYEAARFEIEPGVTVEVASVPDLEPRSHPMISAQEPEIRVSRGPAVPQSSN